MKNLLKYFIMIKSKHFIYKDNAYEITCKMFSIYYKSLFGLIRVSCYYSSYSQAYNAPIRFKNRY